MRITTVLFLFRVLDLKDFCEPDAKVAKFDTEDSLDNSSSNQTTSLEQSPSNHLRTAVGGNSCFSMSKKYKVFRSMCLIKGRS